jgi:hypothetical protein
VIWFSISRLFLIDPCVNEVLVDAVSPSNRRRAVLFKRSCGATTGFSFHVSVLNRDESLPPAGGNVFRADDNHGAVTMDVHIGWESRDGLLVNYPAPAHVFRQATELKDVRIAYVAYVVSRDPR